MTMSPVYVWAKCKGWAYTTQERVSPPIWSFSFFISVWIRSVQQLLIVVNSHNAIQHHDYRCYTTANLLVLFDAAVVWFVWALYLVYRLTNDSHSAPVNMWVRLFDAAIIVMVCNHSSWSGITYGLGYAYSWTIFAWHPNTTMDKKKHTNTSIYRCCRLAFYWGRLVLLDLLLL